MLCLATLIGVLCGPISAADKPAGKDGSEPNAKGAKQAFPSQQVDEILKGWNGIEWGTTLDQFKAKYPKASKNAAERWSTGAGDDKLAGIPGTSLYGFNKKGELNLVVFEPIEAERKTLRDKLIDAGVLRENVKANWQRDGVSFVCAETDIGQFVVIVNAKFADPKAAK